MKNYEDGAKLRTIELNKFNVGDKHKYKVEIKCMLFSCSKTNVSWVGAQKTEVTSHGISGVFSKKRLHFLQEVWEKPTLDVCDFVDFFFILGRSTGAEALERKRRIVVLDTILFSAGCDKISESYFWNCCGICGLEWSSKISWVGGSLSCRSDGHPGP